MHPTHLHRPLAALLLLVSTPAAQESRPRAPSTREAATSRPSRTFERVVMLGASVTAGFERGRRILEDAIGVPHEDVRSFGNIAFGVAPKQMLSVQIDGALRAEPTLVIAMDALFWFLYQPAPNGQGCDQPRARDRKEPAATAERRLALLEAGLAQLARLEGPLVLGEVPDMHDVPFYLRGEQVPAPDTLERANQRIHRFAKERGHCLVLPFATWVRELREGRLLLPPGLAKDPAERFPAERVLQADRLHPSELGQVLLAAWLVRSLAAWLASPTHELALDAERLANHRR